MPRTCPPTALKDDSPVCYRPNPSTKDTRQMGIVLLEAMGVKVMPLKGR